MGVMTSTRPGAAPPRDDQQIQRDVLEELKWDARVQPNEVGVTVRDAVVTLTGWVDNYGKKWTAERTTHRVSGVRAVANDIEVRLPTSAERTDADLADAATRALEWDAFVPLDMVEVTVSRGWLTLKGQVEWEYQRRSAERAARRLSGVRGVTNLVGVRPRARPSPEQVRRDIEDALVRNAETDADQVTVEVDDDRVILAGPVRSWTEKQEAERVAWSAPGVATVDNRIVVAL
jgi:osmotically-inducible protein OsmY